MGGNPNLQPGQIPSAIQWNGYFSSKQDNLGYRPVNSGGDVMAPDSNFSTAAATALGAGLSILPGSSPNDPQDGDIWITGLGIYVQVNGQTVGPLIDNFIPPPVTYPVLAISANYTVKSTDRIINVDATSASCIITVPLSLGVAFETLIFRITKTDQTSNIVEISDGTNIVDFISAPAGVNGQISGWRDVYSIGNGICSMGVG